MNIRIGHGYDVHQLIESEYFVSENDGLRKTDGLILGGVGIPHSKILKGHSDADVLIHAIIDALLGAAGLEDIGSYFPPSDDKYKGISSIELLKESMQMIAKHLPSYKIQNIDCTIMAEKPKMKPHIIKMREKLAEIIGIDLGQINIKATTTEKLGFVGREEGIAAEAVCLIDL